MATWEDGPEYAPIVRPDHFADVAAPPLEPAPPPPAVPAAPPDRPRFAEPDAPVPQLSELVPPPAETRDPKVPFEVVTSAATAATSAWSAAHWSPPATALNGPSATLWPAPDGQPSGSPTPSWPAPSPYAAPGTVGWFAPPPSSYPPAAPPALEFREVLTATTPGVLISLLVGGLISALAPITLCVAFGLSTRIQLGGPWVRRAIGVAVGLLAFIGLVTMLGDRTFSEWWLLLARWAQLLSWIMIVVGPVLVWQASKRTGAAPPPGPWS